MAQTAGNGPTLRGRRGSRLNPIRGNGHAVHLNMYRCTSDFGNSGAAVFKVNIAGKIIAAGIQAASKPSGGRASQRISRSKSSTPASIDAVGQDLARYVGDTPSNAKSCPTGRARSNDQRILPGANQTQRRPRIGEGTLEAELSPQFPRNKHR